MVCVSKWKHDFDKYWVIVEERDGKLKARNTSLGADNGIGVATMMALADQTERPTLELLFTIGEEVGLVGAQNITLPITAPYALNLDWCNSESIWIWCGGTLLIRGEQELSHLPQYEKEWCISITLQWMQGWHSGEDIRYYRGNALLEIIQCIKQIPPITHIENVKGGEADNAIPHASTFIGYYEWNLHLLQNELDHFQKKLREKYNCKNISLSYQHLDKKISLYSVTDILPYLETIQERGTGVQVWWKENTPLSSWNLGILSLKDQTLITHYFLRSNLPQGIEEMEKIFLEDNKTQWTMTQKSPPWVNTTQEISLSSLLESTFIDEDNNALPCVTTHAAVECGLLAQKYPQTEWISIGATVHNMHTVEEYIEIRDFEEFVERVKNLLSKIENK